MVVSGVTAVDLLPLQMRRPCAAGARSAATAYGPLRWPATGATGGVAPPHSCSGAGTAGFHDAAAIATAMRRQDAGGRLGASAPPDPCIVCAELLCGAAAVGTLLNWELAAS